MPLLRIRENPKPTKLHYLHITRNPKKEKRLHRGSQGTSPPFFSSSILSVVGFAPCTPARWLELSRGGQYFPVTLFFLREENLSRSPPASFLSHRSELGHMVTLTPSSWQEWNLHDSWRVRPQLTFPKAQGAAENSRFLNKIEVLLEQ